MKNRTIIIITLLAIIAISGIAVVQVFWFQNAFDVKEKQFDQNVFTALQNVGEQILTVNQQQIPNSGLVDQLSSNYFVVSVNGEIDTKILESLLKAEFKNRELLDDFEYGVYDCNHQKLVYGNYVSFDKKETGHLGKELPQWKNDLYYFSVNFPEKSNQIAGSLGIWLFSTAVLLLVIVFFAFALIAIFRQKQLSEVQKDFVNNMTHEFKTPVSTILISSKLLGKEEVQKDASAVNQYVALIQSEAQRLKAQVERILQVAVWDEKNLKYQFENINVHDCLDQAINGVGQLAKEKNGKIIRTFNANELMVNADKMHLTNAFYNLLENAIKYNQHEPLIEVTTSVNKNFITINLKDNGIGIDRKNLKKIFDRFYRVHTGDVHDVKGFGLGLFYVKKVITDCKGKIEVTSEINKGTTFNIKLPL